MGETSFSIGGAPQQAHCNHFGLVGKSCGSLNCSLPKQGQENAFKGPLIDMDLHDPPCRRFHANQAFYVCGQIAQLLLRAVQYQLLPIKTRLHGLRPLIRYLMRGVARLVRTGRRWTPRFLPKITSVSTR